MAYGGIDSNGVTERAVEMTALMASVAQRHAVEISRMIALKELYLLPNGDRKLLRGVNVLRSPAGEIGGVSSVRGLKDTPETLTFEGAMKRGTKTVTLSFLNGHWNREERKGQAPSGGSPRSQSTQAASSPSAWSSKTSPTFRKATPATAPTSTKARIGSTAAPE